MKKIIEMLYGSHLYGLDTPESDKDYKGIYVPTMEEILLGNYKKSISTTTGGEGKNAKEDVDTEIYSIQYFVKLALDGQTVAIDMLHSAPEFWLEWDVQLWGELYDNRQRFYTKNLAAFVGYARKQAAKYGIKGSRLATTKEVLAVLERYDEMTRLEDVPELWVEGTFEHAKVEERGDDRFLNVCGRMLQHRARVKTYVPVMQKFIDEFGDRARKAEKNEGVDWKAISHALRAGYVCRRILLEGESGGVTSLYPLDETEYILRVKAGRMDYADAASELERLLDELDVLRKVSDLPEEPEYDWANRWLLDVLQRRVSGHF